MHKSHKLLSLWAAAVVVISSIAVGGETFGASTASYATKAAAAMTGSGSAHAQLAQTSVNAAEQPSAGASQEVSALAKFRQQRSAVLGTAHVESESAPPMSLTSIILIGLLAVAVAVIGALLWLLPKGTIKGRFGTMGSSSSGNKVSGRVAAARLVGRSDVDIHEGALEALQDELHGDAAMTAKSIDTQASAPPAPRVQRVVMPTPEAVARSLVPPSIRRPGGGMASAAATALRQQAQNRETTPTKGKDEITVQRSNLSDRADRMFRELQRFYGFGSRSQLQGLLTPELFREIEGSLVGQDGSGIPQVLGLLHEVVSIEDAGDHFVGVVAYKATLKFEGMPPERSNELFRFVKSKAAGTQYWKLASIQQLQLTPQQMSR